jgi:hypothetical protein
MSRSALMAAVAQQPVVFYFTVDSTWQNYRGGAYAGTGVGRGVGVLEGSGAAVLAAVAQQPVGFFFDVDSMW